MSSPSVSIIIAVYNGEKYLHKALSSVFKQSFTDYEVVMVNDASNDRTGEVLRSFSDNRLRIINNKNNLGLTKSLNIGLDAANAEFIARIDADDIWHEKHLQSILALINQKNNVVLAGNSHFEFFSDDEIDKFANDRISENAESSVITFEDLQKKNIFCHSAVIFRKNINGNNIKYREEFKCSQDYDLWFRLYFMGKVLKSETVTCFYKRSSHAVSLEKAEEQIYYALIATKLAEERKNAGTDLLAERGCFPELTKNEKDIIKRKTCNVLLYFSCKLMEKIDIYGAVSLAVKAFCFSPVRALKELLSLIIYG